MAKIFNRCPWIIATIVIFLLLVVGLNDYRNTPAYHDGVMQWEYAQTFAERPGFPFIKSADTGHPPLVAYTLGVLSWVLPVPMVRLMHLLGLAATAAFIASVTMVAFRVLPRPVAVGVTLWTALHPVIIAQSIQVNLDLYMTAFIWMGVYACLLGRPWLMALALSGATMSKLNGGFALFPFGVLWIWLLWSARKSSSVKQLAASAIPLFFPVVVFAIYHLAKKSIVGRFFSTDEFESGDQLGIVSSPNHYFIMIQHSLKQVFFNNGNEFPALLALAGLVGIFGYLIYRGDRLRLMTAPESPGRVWRPLTTLELGGLVLVLAVSQILFQSIRAHPTLMRYFMMTYPVLFATALLPWMSIAGHYRREFFAAVIAIGAIGYYTRQHPDRAIVQVTPPFGVWSNYELSLQFPDALRTFQRSVRYIDARHPTSAVMTVWPFSDYLQQPSYGFTDNGRWIVWEPDPELDMIIIKHSFEYHRLPHPISPEGADIPEGFTLVRVNRRGTLTWTAIFASDEAIRLRLLREEEAKGRLDEVE